MGRDALDRRAKAPFSKAEKRKYARMMKEQEERRSLMDPAIVKKHSDQFKKTIEAQLKAAGLKKS